MGIIIRTSEPDELNLTDIRLAIEDEGYFVNTIRVETPADGLDGSESGQYVVTYTSPVLAAENADDAIAQAADVSGGHWEAERV